MSAFRGSRSDKAAWISDKMRDTIAEVSQSFIAYCFAGLVLMSGPASAHHSFIAEYDADQPVTVKGVIAKVEWENPHIHFYLDVTDEHGNVEHWKFEGFPPN